MTSTVNSSSFNASVFDKISSLDGDILWLVDRSGSVDNVQRYHDLSMKIFRSTEKRPHHIIGWDDSFHPMSDDQFITDCTRMKGYGGTRTSAIAQYLSTLTDSASLAKKYNLVILTDGNVDISDIARCDAMMTDIAKRIHINSVTAFISSYFSVNCSVLAPFLRGEWSSMVYHDNHINSHLTSVHFMDVKERAELFEIVKTATSPAEISAIYDRLMALLSAMMMGKSSPDPNLRSMICETFARIKSNIAKFFDDAPQLVALRNEFASTKNISTDSARKFVDCYTSSTDMKDFETKLNALLHICDAKLSRVFDPAEIRRQALNRATTATIAPTDVQLVNIEAAPDAQNIAECPVMMGSDYAMGVMIKEGTPLFSTLDKPAQDFLMSNTFSACANKSLIELLKQRIDHAVSLQAFVAMQHTSGAIVSPITRDAISVIIPLGADPVSVRAANYAIGQLVLGHKGVIGNANVWFYVLYDTIKSGGAPWLEPILPLIEKQLVYRMEHTQCQLSHSGLPAHVQARGTWGSALRFLFSQIEIGMPKEKSSFPTFSSSSAHIMKLLELYGCVLPESIKKYCTVVRYAGILVNECKQLHLDAFQVKYTQALIRNFYRISRDSLSPEILAEAERNGWFYEYIPLDGPQTDLPNFAAELPADIRCMMYNLATKIHSESITVFTLMESVNYNDIDSIYAQPVTPANDWPIYTKYTPYNDKIHPATMRPMTYVKNGDDKIHWQDSYVNFFNGDAHYTKTIFSGTDGRPCSDVFCGCKMYASFVEKFRQHPTLADFVLYCFATCKNSQYAHKTIPCVAFCESVMTSFEFSRTLPVDDFISKYLASRNREDRLRIECGTAPDMTKIITDLNLQGICHI